VNGNIVKQVDTLVSYHGFETKKNGYTPTDNFLENGHLEVFYFTKLYGLTRWEVWAPQTTNQNIRNRTYYSQSSECNGQGFGIYKDVNFSIINCHDWSNVKARKSSSSMVPIWPLVNANILKHGHFDSNGLSENYFIGKWCRFGTTSSGKMINWSSLISTGGGDANDGIGMAYLAFNCGADSSSNYQCGTPGSQVIYQDIAVDGIMVCNGCGYMYGVNVRTETGTGTIQIALQLLDHNSIVIWQSVQETAIKADNGDGRGSEADSVYLSAKFVYHTVQLPTNITSSASKLRFLIIPVTTNTFFVVDSFVNRFSLQ
jgi:hypothetical protein